MIWHIILVTLSGSDGGEKEKQITISAQDFSNPTKVDSSSENPSDI
jgi:hypothetical protein